MWLFLAAAEFGESRTLPREHKATSLFRETLQKYVGTYRLAPAFALTVFVPDADGAITHLILHQGGRETKGVKEQ